MLDWIFEGIITWVSSVVTDLMDAVSGLFLQALGTDMIAMEEYFPFVTKAFTVMQYTAWAILFLITVWQLFRIFGGPMTDAENPWTLIARSALMALLIGYAKPIFSMVLDIARAPYTALMDIQLSAEDFTFAGIEAMLMNGLTTLIATISVVGLLLLVILELCLGWNYFKLLLETVERYTNDRGYAKSADIPYGTYRVVETTFPFNYEGDGQTEWTVTINTAKGALATIDASNKLKKGHIEILKSDAESGKDLSGAEFTIYDYDGEEIAVIGPTDSKGYAKSGEITYGRYIVKETKVPVNYQPDGDAEWHITIDDNAPLITLDIANLRQYGSVKVIKTAEDGLVNGLKFKLTGTSVYGEEVSLTATTNEVGVAVFERVPIGVDYTLSEVSTPNRYVIPEAQNITVEWNKVTERQFHNVLKKWRADILKVDADLRWGGGGGPVPVFLSLNSDEIIDKLGSP